MMTVYVDNARLQFRRMVMCHMVADSVDELHEMADAIGVNRRWFQGEASYPHYDVCLSKRERAINLGAAAVPSKELIQVARRMREGCSRW